MSLSDEDDLFSEGSDLNSEELSEDDEEDVELTEEEMAERKSSDSHILGLFQGFFVPPLLASQKEEKEKTRGRVQIRLIL